MILATSITLIDNFSHVEFVFVVLTDAIGNNYYR